jgi:hypothetical protein
MTPTYMTGLGFFIVTSSLFLFADFMLNRFRKNLKAGDQVGARFGDTVVNREVIHVAEGKVLVKGPDLKKPVEVELKLVFLPDRYSPPNQAVDENSPVNV